LPRVLLFATTTGYQIREFDAAARRLGIELRLATDRCHVMDDPWGDRAVAVEFDRPSELSALRLMQLDGVAAVGDAPAVLAAEAAEMLGLPFHPSAAARACHDKFQARQLYQAAGLPVPSYFRAALADDPGLLAMRTPYPCVLKPVGLSASRGVIRANGPADFLAAFARIGAMLSRSDSVQVESYIPGAEFAVEGLVTAGAFEPLAIFDKPDPLDGPFFEETIYVTPSRQPSAVQRALLDMTGRAVKALGLRHGPVHAELRYNAQGAWILEVAARPIGGLCSRVLRFGEERLEEVILRHALGHTGAPQTPLRPSGVMMAPIPRPGIYQSTDGVEQARSVPGIEDVVITAKQGQKLVPLPEGASYLGFIFARGESSEEVERALRRSHAELRFEITTALDVLSSSSSGEQNRGAKPHPRRRSRRPSVG
jgi:biotin carboxylase